MYRGFKVRIAISVYYPSLSVYEMTQCEGRNTINANAIRVPGAKRTNACDTRRRRSCRKGERAAPEKIDAKWSDRLTFCIDWHRLASILLHDFDAKTLCGALHEEPTVAEKPTFQESHNWMMVTFELELEQNEQATHPCFALHLEAFTDDTDHISDTAT